jgi:hypothetical protein
VRARPRLARLRSGRPVDHTLDQRLRRAHRRRRGDLPHGGRLQQRAVRGRVRRAHRHGVQQRGRTGLPHGRELDPSDRRVRRAHQHHHRDLRGRRDVLGAQRHSPVPELHDRHHQPLLLEGVQLRYVPRRTDRPAHGLPLPQGHPERPHQPRGLHLELLARGGRLGSGLPLGRWAAPPHHAAHRLRRRALPHARRAVRHHAVHRPDLHRGRPHRGLRLHHGRAPHRERQLPRARGRLHGLWLGLPEPADGVGRAARDHLPELRARRGAGLGRDALRLWQRHARERRDRSRPSHHRRTHAGVARGAAQRCDVALRPVLRLAHHQHHRERADPRAVRAPRVRHGPGHRQVLSGLPQPLGRHRRSGDRRRWLHLPDRVAHVGGPAARHRDGLQPTVHVALGHARARRQRLRGAHPPGGAGGLQHRERQPHRGIRGGLPRRRRPRHGREQHLLGRVA